MGGSKAEAEKQAAISACDKLFQLGLLQAPRGLRPADVASGAAARGLDRGGEGGRARDGRWEEGAAAAGGWTGMRKVASEGGMTGMTAQGSMKTGKEMQVSACEVRSNCCRGACGVLSCDAQ